MFTFVYKRLVCWALLAIPGVPLLWSLYGAVAAGLERRAWLASLASPELLPAAGLSVWTGVASSLLTVLLSAHIAQRLFCRTTPGRMGTPWLAAMLSVPHAAFAIGMVALLTPGGWLLRLFSPWASGLHNPPDWTTTQDPWGLGLIAVLVLKETPYLLWMLAAQMQQPDVAARLRQEHSLACTLGYSDQQAWWRVVWPQLLDKLQLPCLAVLAYGLGTVDVSLVIGPTSPPTLAVLAWHWMQDADPATNAQGAAAAWMLWGLMAISACTLYALQRLPHWRRARTRGADTASPTSGAAVPTALLPLKQWGGSPTVLRLIYVAVLLALGLGSAVGVWPFPAVLPQSWTTAAWQSVWESRAVLATTLWLALASAGAALLWSVAWLEWADKDWRRSAAALWYVPLGLPAVLWLLGLHRMVAVWGIDATGYGLWLAHTIACLPYVLLGLSEPYGHFNPALQTISRTLGRSRLVFLWQVKWPLLKAPLAFGFAVGFAVSVAQYLPTLYVGAGRFATVATEAVNLAAGGQRSLASAYAWLQWLVPLVVFAAAGVVARPRKFARR